MSSTDKTGEFDENFEFNAIYEDEYFIISSDNLDKIKPKLYGFALYDGKIISDLTISNEDSLTGHGTYIWVKKEDDIVTIYQDFNGCYGLYLFRKDDYFAISNSFLKLVEYLKERYVLTLDEDYAKALISVRHGSFAYHRTLVNEIRILDRNSIVLIDTINKTLSVDKIDYREHTLSLDSEEGMAALDTWYNKWIDIIRFLKENTENLSVDLSGGFDTRMLLALMLGSDIDLSTIKVFSRTDKKHTHEEDFEIASQLADYYGFELNKPLDTSPEFFSQLRTPINISFYVKLGFHRQMYYKLNLYNKPTVSITGGGGGSVRGFWLMDPEEFIEDTKKSIKVCSSYFEEPAERLIRESYEIIKQKYGITDNSSEYIPLNIFRDIRSRSHVGRAYVGNYLVNAITLTPLVDPDIHQLRLTTDECRDNQLLLTVILTRFAPKLLDFKFDSGRSINPETIKYAKNLNEKYPFKPQKRPLISKTTGKLNIPVKKIPTTSQKVKVRREDCERYMRDVFITKSFKHSFEKYYPSQMYDFILNMLKGKDFFPLADVYTAMAPMKIIEDVEYSQQKNYETSFDWLTHYLEIEEYPDTRVSPMSENRIRELLKRIPSIKEATLPQTLIDTIKSEKLFDEYDYMDMYSDVKKANISPFDHFVKYGFREGRLPSKNPENNEKVNRLIYNQLKKDADISRQPQSNKTAPKKSKILLDDTRKKELLKLLPPLSEETVDIIKRENLFDETFYLTKYADIKNAGIDAFTHFIKSGYREGRVPSASPEKNKRINEIIKDYLKNEFKK